MASVEWVGDGDQHAQDETYTEPAFYVVDPNGIVAGPFDDEGEACWWLDKSKRV